MGIPQRVLLEFLFHVFSIWSNQAISFADKETFLWSDKNTKVMRVGRIKNWTVDDGKLGYNGGSIPIATIY